MLEALALAESEAMSRYKETTELVRQRLEGVRAEVHAASSTAASATSSATSTAGSSTATPQRAALQQLAHGSWLAAMLLSTSEDALRATHALMRMREQHAADALANMQRDLQGQKKQPQQPLFPICGDPISPVCQKVMFFLLQGASSLLETERADRERIASEYDDALATAKQAAAHSRQAR